MDPLFGFNGYTKMEQLRQGQTSGEEMAVGEYTISFPVDQTQNYVSQQGHAEFGSSSTSQQSNQVVHVVSGSSTDDKHVYVIKLENLLQDGSNRESLEANANAMGIQMEAVEDDNFQDIQSIKDEQDCSNEDGDDAVTTSSSSESEGTEEPENNNENEQDQGPDPFLVVSPEAVMGMAQSVGVDLAEEVASELGCLAMNKLRRVILVALQFAQHENSEGITVEHFAKAEEQLGSTGAGHESVFRETPYKYAGGVSVLDDGPEIDLYASIRQTEDTEMSIDLADPVLNVQHLRTYDENSQSHAKTDIAEEPVLECVSGNEVVEVDNDAVLQDALEGDEDGDGDNNGDDGMNDSSDDDKPEDEDNLVESIVKDIEAEHDDTVEQNEKEETSDEEMNEALAPEWTAYLQLLYYEVMTHNYKRDFNCFVKTDFQRILQDIRLNGFHPIFHTVCDGFQDYLRQPEVSQPTIMNILSVLDALVTGRCELSLEQLNDIGSTLIEVIILPPPCEVHHLLTHVFMKVLKKCNELLTWTCTYVTEMLKGISETPLDQLVETFKSTMHGALCLANGLEELKIQVAQEFGWHTCLLTFIKTHCTVFDGEAYSPSIQDSYLEEEILKFYHNFLNNYVSLVPPQELTKIREIVESVYGEKFMTFVPPFSHIVSKKTGPASQVKGASNKKIRCVYKKLVYKNREIIVPCRKRVK